MSTYKDPAKNLGGAPPKYKSVEEMQAKIDAYFKSCEPHEMTDKEGNIIYNQKTGEPCMTAAKPYTVTGLALALDFTSRQALLNYQAKPEFVDAVTRAKARVEQYAESRLYDKEGSNGAKFALANNFATWTEKREIENKGTMEVKIEGKVKDWAK